MTDRSNTDAAADDGVVGRGNQTYDVAEDVEPGVGVVEAVADATGESPMTLPPLYETVDVDALNSVLSHAERDERVLVTLNYADHVVVIDGEGTITVS